MKKFTLIILLLQISLFSLFAQVQLKHSTHGMKEGDILPLKSLETEAMDWDNKPGVNKQWDFSTLKIKEDRKIIEYNVDLSAGSELGKAFACRQDDKITSLYSVSPTAKLYKGLISENSEILFHEPIKELVFPFKYGDEIKGKMIGSYTTLTDGATEDINGDYSVEADAWGNLVLPNGVSLKNVLRVKYVKDYKQMHYGHLFHVTVKHYLFYAAESRYPVMQIKEAVTTSDYACGNSAEIYASFDDEVRASYKKQDNQNDQGENNNKQDLKKFTYELYPNPFDNQFTLNYELNFDAKVKISILELSGKEQMILVNSKHKQGIYSISKDLRKLAHGTHLLRINAGDKEYVEKIIKRK
jgi:hypothetical protein